jgi:hypothetical protein
MAENKKQEIRYPENRELGKKLKKGDRVEIADLCKLKPKYVRDIFQGFRHNDHAVAWGKRLIADREQRLKEIEKPTRRK